MTFERVADIPPRTYYDSSGKTMEEVYYMLDSKLEYAYDLLSK